MAVIISLGKLMMGQDQWTGQSPDNLERGYEK